MERGCQKLASTVNANTRFGVLSDAFLEEVCYALKADCFHPFERIPSFEVTVQPRQRRSRSAQNLI
jgi:hypothetical protein